MCRTDTLSDIYDLYIRCKDLRNHCVERISLPTSCWVVSIEVCTTPWVNTRDISTKLRTDHLIDHLRVVLLALYKHLLHILKILSQESITHLVWSWIEWTLVELLELGSTASQYRCHKARSSDKFKYLFHCLLA